GFPPPHHRRPNRLPKLIHAFNHSITAQCSPLTPADSRSSNKYPHRKSAATSARTPAMTPRAPPQKPPTEPPSFPAAPATPHTAAPKPPAQKADTSPAT